jgi:hypothetical protein
MPDLDLRPVTPEVAIRGEVRRLYAQKIDGFFSQM